MPEENRDIPGDLAPWRDYQAPYDAAEDGLRLLGHNMPPETGEGQDQT